MALFIHIGMGKAGSTQLQNTLAGNVERLAELGLDYPEVGREGVNHHPLATALTRPGGADDPLWAEFREYLGAADRDVVLSSEAFEGVEPNVLRKALRGHGARIICYVRPQVLRMPSFYTQNTKYGLNTLPFDEFFEAARPAVSRQWIYSEFIRFWAEQFEQVRLRSLDEWALNSLSLTVDFLNACDVAVDGATVGTEVAPPTDDDPAPPGWTPTLPREGSNESPGWQLVEALRDFHARVVADDRSMVDRMNDPTLWPYLQRAFALAEPIGARLGWTDKGWYLSREQFDLLDDMYRRDIENIRKMSVDAVLTPPTYGELVRPHELTVDRIPLEARHEFWATLATALLRDQLGR